jgi:hypothetical protein
MLLTTPRAASAHLIVVHHDVGLCDEAARGEIGAPGFLAAQLFEVVD